MALNAVVFPAPFGPIRLVIVPGCTRNEIPASAMTPPNSTRRSDTSSIIRPALFTHAAFATNRPGGLRDRHHDAAWQKEHAHDEHDAVREHLPLPGHRLPQCLG